MQSTRNQILQNPRFRTQSGRIPAAEVAVQPKNLLSVFYQLPGASKQFNNYLK